MYRYHWIIRGKLAVLLQPFEENIKFLTEIFDAVIILLEPDELMYDLEEWRRRNVDVMHVPVPPLYIPALLELYKMTLWISGKIKSGKKVLVHCYGASAEAEPWPPPTSSSPKR
ncbi:MAG: protein-tyrosine phosphatase family protein [Candidatus Baldrarchaeia archaeon]